MLCPFCKNKRIENEAPCPYCGAPSPQQHQPQANSWSMGDTNEAAWGNNETSSSPSNVQWGAQIPQLSFDAYQQPQQPEYQAPQWSQSSGQLNNSAPAWPQSSSSFDNAAPAWQQPNSAELPMPTWQQSTYNTPSQELPQLQNNQAQALVPYQNNNMPGESGTQTLSLQLIQEHAISHLIQQPDVTPMLYVPPTFTEPRPLIPRYRIISGFLSVLIVMLLLCSAAGYFAKTSGMLDSVGRMFGGAPPNEQQVTIAQKLPDPPNTIDQGPAYNIIPSATTASNIDTKNNVAEQRVQIFQPGHVFYITYSVQAPGNDGTVSVKWYTNKNLYRVEKLEPPVKANEIKNGYASMQYTQPAEGMVELYWNNQLAQRQYFVVR